MHLEKFHSFPCHGPLLITESLAEPYLSLLAGAGLAEALVIPQKHVNPHLAFMKMLGHKCACIRFHFPFKSL